MKCIKRKYVDFRFVNLVSFFIFISSTYEIISKGRWERSFLELMLLFFFLLKCRNTPSHLQNTSTMDSPVMDYLLD
jgi:hypothetical protein